MSLTLNETFRVNAPAERVWAFLKNPADVVTCLPGAELTETIDAQTYGGRVKVKVGPITAAYAGKATLTQVDDVARRMQLVGEGKESGGSGSARMTMTGVVTAIDGATTEVSVDAVIDIAGRVMQIGRNLIESVNKQLFRQFADAVRTKLEAAEEASDQRGASSPAALPDAPPSTVTDQRSLPPVAVSDTPPATTMPPSIATGVELRALPLLWKVLVEWLRGLFGGKR